MNLAELRFGARRPEAEPEDETRLEVFVGLLPVLAFDRAAADAYDSFGERMRVRRNGFDLLIAAHAVAVGATLVTSNQRDLGDISRLRVENGPR